MDGPEEAWAARGGLGSQRRPGAVRDGLENTSLGGRNFSKERGFCSNSPLFLVFVVGGREALTGFDFSFLFFVFFLHSGQLVG